MTRARLITLVGAFALLLSLASVAQARLIPVRTTIQAAVDAARPGDVVLVPAGRYRENVVVSTDAISIVGLQGAVLDGTGLAGPVGIRVAPLSAARTLHGFRLQGLRVGNYAGDGVLLWHVDDFAIVDDSFVDNADYGVFPVLSSNGLVAANRASGSDDTGIYVGQSSDVSVAGNRAEENTVGFDIENSVRIRVTGNQATGNTLGLVVQGAPGLTIANASDIAVSGNQLTANNRPNPATDPTDLLSLLGTQIRLSCCSGVFVDQSAESVAAAELVWRAWADEA